LRQYNLTRKSKLLENNLLLTETQRNFWAPLQGVDK
jgi:hypothetical protein